MGFGSTTEEEFRDHLQQLGLCSGGKIVVHSALTSFGRIPGSERTVLRILTEVLGQRGVLVVPTFTFELRPSAPFNRLSEKPTGMGALSNLVWNLDQSTRTRSCIHSYASIGGLVEEMKNVRDDCSFGSGSFFDLAVENNLLWVMLGCGINNGCTLLHHAEEIAGVPYRRMVYLPRNLEEEDGSIKRIRYRYYARDEENPRKNDFSRLQERMLAEGTMTAVEALHGTSYSAYSSDIAACATKLLEADPYVLTNAITLGNGEGDSAELSAGC